MAARVASGRVRLSRRPEDPRVWFPAVFLTSTAACLVVGVAMSIPHNIQLPPVHPYRDASLLASAQQGG